MADKIDQHAEVHGTGSATNYIHKPDSPSTALVLAVVIVLMVFLYFAFPHRAW